MLKQIRQENPFPIYWVPQRVGSKLRRSPPIPGITFPIYWVPQRVGRSPASFLSPRKIGVGFQFIGFPSEWGGEVLEAALNGFMFPIYWVPQRVGR